MSQECYRLAHELRQRIDSIKNTSPPHSDSVLAQCTVQLDKLSALVREISPSLPAREQQVLSRSCSDLATDVNALVKKPRKKFALKKFAPAADAQTTSSAEPALLPPDSSSVEKPRDADASRGTFEVIDRRDAHVVAQHSDHLTASSVIIEKVNRSVIDVGRLAGSASTLTIRNAEHCLFFCGDVRGPVHLTGLRHCIILLACRQLRVHDSYDTRLYSHCSSRSIIERCERLVFAPLPELWIPSTSRDMQNKWDQIDDFGWLKSEPSPNFTVLDGAQSSMSDLEVMLTEKSKYGTADTGTLRSFSVD